MLKHLSIQNFVIVDRMALEFSPGFTVLTGETGAGKSILIDALSLVLGERGDANQIRQGCERAEISALFDIRTLTELSAWLNEQDLQSDTDDCLLRRILDSSGRSRAFINGHAATLQQLRSAGEYLVAIHSQHAHQLLLQKDAQRELLDAFAHCRELAQDVKTAYKSWQNLQRQRIACEQQLSDILDKREQLVWQIGELSDLNVSCAEWESLQTDHHRLSHLAGLVEATESAIDALSENETAVFGRINTVKSQLQQVAEYDVQLQTMIGLLESAQIQVQESIYELRHYRQQLDLDPQSLQEIEQRIAAIHHLARRYRVQPEELPDFLEKLMAQRDALDHAGNLDQLTEQEHAALQAYQTQARKLSAKRAKAAKEMSQAVTESMQILAMTGGIFSVTLTALEQSGVNGLEQVEFQVAAHKSLPLKPLAKVASGGELSRISLALQVIASSSGMAPTLIFDEVDVGIGGRVAEIVGQLLRRLGHTRQVLCITHLPQVAATGDHHWQVMKSGAEGGRQINSQIKVLDVSARIEEIARMLGGVTITDATRRHAAEMLHGNTEPTEEK
ncbi:MAG: DNA repair protein RecN [Nitrosomonas sp.]|nr:DNA repair protein RecN [Nitrosomonas sp.]MCW5606705.1 DNA repair protein RecN [Nitrosomonas sp.]